MPLARCSVSAYRTSCSKSDFLQSALVSTDLKIKISGTLNFALKPLLGKQKYLRFKPVIRETVSGRGRSGVLQTEFRDHLLRTKSSEVLPLKPGVHQNIAMHASPTARNFFLANFCNRESWTLTAELQRIRAMEMRCFRKTLCISYKDHVTNEEVRAKIQ